MGYIVITLMACMGPERIAMKVSVYEDNGGMIHAVVMDGGEIKNIISGFEDETMSLDEFIAAAKTGFEWADEYDPENYSGLTMEQVAQEIIDLDDLIAEITPDGAEMYPEKMGTAGMILFGIERE